MSIGGIGGCGGGCNLPSLTEMRQKMFNRMDQDGDGVISSSECATAASDMSQKTGLSITADEMMSIFDLNQDGVITQAEQTEASPEWEKHMASLMEGSGMRPMGPPPPPPDMSSEMSDLVDQIFSAMDTNEDGVIDQSEYETAMEELGNQTESTTAEASSSDSSTSEAAATDAETSTASTEDNSLAALLAQFLDLLGTMEKDYYAQYSQESQNFQGMDYFA
ncbi:MAG: EF-hand domain-containing protein [Syntrophales bacterium]|nr:EF-hand domain-containing protein [Syntrophales bacterium]MDD5642704.1 EF-hand domain-containing protein [Syntrophales bacterium]